MATTEQTTSNAALAYSKRGLRVIPLYAVDSSGKCTCPQAAECTSSGKHPVSNGWQKAPRTSEQYIEKMFEDRNVGIATGKDSGIFVVDVDPGSGGFESAKQWTQDYGWDTSQTHRVKTGSGGFHFYYQLPDFEVRNSVSKLAPGIDIRGEGGQVVAPPSVSSKGSYRSVGNSEIAEAPEWLLDMLRPEETKKPKRKLAPKDPIELPDGEPARLLAYSEGAVVHEVGRLTALEPAGWDLPWNQTTYEVACNLIQLANTSWTSIDPEDAYRLVFENAPRDSGFTDEIVNRTFESASKMIGDKETPLPDPPDRPDMSFMFPDEDDSPKAEGIDEVTGSSMSGIGGIPLIDGVLDPHYGKSDAAARLGRSYSSEKVEFEVVDVDLDPHTLVPSLQTGPGADLPAVEAWVARWIRSGSPELFWEALGCLLGGVDDLKVSITIKGISDLLRCFGGLARPHVGPDPGVLHWGPRLMPVQGGEIFIEFAAQSSTLEMSDHLNAFIERATRAYTAARARGGFSVGEAHEHSRSEDSRVVRNQGKLIGISTVEREVQGNG